MFENFEIFWKTFGGDKLLKCMDWLSHGISYTFGSLNKKSQFDMENMINKSS